MATTQPKSTNEVVYQVEIHIEKAFREDYLTWLEKEHVPQMLELENNSIFIGAEILEPIDEDSASQTHTIVIQYRVISNEKLQHYFKTHAEGMRTKFQGKTFDGKFTASRKVLKQLSFIKGMPQSNAFGYVF